MRTSALVAERLESFGIEVHRGLAKTGVVGTLRCGTLASARSALRADMDALPIQERTDLPYRSTRDGAMHACGHDGHTTMLLGAARYLAATRDFDGIVRFIFQPAEENEGGGKRDDRRRACSRSSRSSASTVCTTFRACPRAPSRCAWVRSSPPTTSSRSSCAAAAPTPRCRTSASIRCRSRRRSSTRSRAWSRAASIRSITPWSRPPRSTAATPGT